MCVSQSKLINPDSVCERKVYIQPVDSGRFHMHMVSCIDQKLVLGFVLKPHCSQHIAKSPGSRRKGGSLALCV